MATKKKVKRSKSKKVSSKKVIEKGKRQDLGTTAEESKVLKEVDVVNDVIPPKCICKDSIRGKNHRYKPHLCPIEPIVKYTLYNELHRNGGILEPYSKRAQIFRRVESALSLGQQTLRNIDMGLSKRTMTPEECQAWVKKYDDLMQRYESEKDPQLARVHSRRAALHLALKNYKEAYRCAMLTAEMDPYHAAAWFQAAMAQLRMGSREQAIGLLLDGLKFNPRNSRLEVSLERLR